MIGYRWKGLKSQGRAWSEFSSPTCSSLTRSFRATQDQVLSSTQFHFLQRPHSIACGLMGFFQHASSFSYLLTIYYNMLIHVVCNKCNTLMYLLHIIQINHGFYFSAVIIYSTNQSWRHSKHLETTKIITCRGQFHHILTQLLHLQTIFVNLS